ncbi:MAG: metal-dependent hydrolase [Candidatus Latescibacteria bacterium]|nr:metal-dependent hydrolase [Candidatus Latescibacterota bacterium]
MENLTHTLLGVTLAKTGLGRWTRWATPALVIGSNLPDVDVLFVRFGEPFAYLTHHRGVSHAAVGMVGLAVLLTVVLWGWDRLSRAPRPHDTCPLSFARVFVLSLIGTASHTLLDFTNSYGVRPWLPFDDRWVYGDLVFIVDPWLWLILGGPLVCLTWRWGWRAIGYGIVAGVLTWIVVVVGAGRVPGPVRWVWGAGLLMIAAARWIQAGRYGPRLARGALAGVVVYWAGLGVAHRMALEDANRYVERVLDNRPVRTLAVMPQPADPFRWFLVAETDSVLYAGQVDLLSPNTIQPPLDPVPRTLDHQAVRAALQTPSGRIMRAFARYLFAEVQHTEQGYLVVLRDLRFGRSNTDGFAVVRIPLRGGS